MADLTEVDIKAALIYKFGWNGAGVFNTPLNLTYSFGDKAIPYWTDADYGINRVKPGTFDSLSDSQKGVFEAAIRSWGAVANITLTPGKPYDGFGDIVVIGGETIPLGNKIIDGVTTPVINIRAANSAGDIVFGNTGQAGSNNNLLEPGQTGYNTFIHELGHALGLKGDEFPELPSDPGQRYTVMSYTPVTGIPDFPEWWASKPML